MTDVSYYCLPKGWHADDATWHETLEDAKEDALDWSVKLCGDEVIVYDDNDKALYAIFA